MKTITPMEGWIRSLPKVLFLPFGGWIILGFLGSRGELSASFLAGAFAGTIGMVIHFASYLVVGIPTYLALWDRGGLIWEWPFGLPLGMILGALTLVVLSLAFFGGVDWSICILGGGYGGLTAIGSCWSRKLEEQ